MKDVSLMAQISASTLAAMPEWTELRQRNGLDPLGMQASSVGLYQRLLPGISNVTLRVRYYGLYAWLSRIYAERIRDTGVESWKRIVRRAEAIYALAAARAARDADHGVAGVLWARRHLSEGGVDFFPHTDPGGAGPPYLQQAMGAYGLAYGSQLYEMGVLGMTDLHGIPVPAPGLGDAVAAAFADAAGPLAEHFFALIEAGRATPEDLDALAPLLPSGIGEDTSERAIYERMLFAESGDAREGDISRRRTLTLALRVAQLLGREIWPDDVRWVLYACANSDGRTLELVDHELSEHRLRWWAYQFSDLGRVACEALLKWLLDALEPHRAGLSADRLVGSALAALDVPSAGWPRTWRALVTDLPQAVSALSEKEPTAERRLVTATLGAGRGAERAPRESARAAVELLAVLHRRSALNPEVAARELGTGGVFRSIATELSFLDAHQDTPLEDLLRRFLEQRVLQRHLWVAMRKLEQQGDYTFLVDADDNRLRLRAKDGPVFTGPRLGPGLTFLRDIHVLDGSGVTERGRRIAAVG